MPGAAPRVIELPRRRRLQLPPPPAHPSEALRLAAQLLVGDPDAIQRLAGGHRRRRDGMCEAHAAREPWPCYAVLVASVVRQLQQAGRPPR